MKQNKKPNIFPFPAPHPSAQVAVDSQFENIAEGVVAPSVSAYTFFQRSQTIAIKDDLINAGQASDFGSVATAVSVRWRGMDSDGRKEFEDLAASDKARFLAESSIRDAEIEEKQRV